MNKLYLVLGFTFLSILIFVSCSKEDTTKHKYTYTGESELWDAKYVVNESVKFFENDDALDVETEDNNVLVVTYKGELKDLSSVKHIEISYECSIESGKQVEDYNDSMRISSKTFTLKSGGKNSALHSGNETIWVSVNIDGNTQIFELKNK